MRVISGTARGTIIHSIANPKTRPTLDRVKESLFNILNNKIDESTVALDLFAGSGAIGIEFLSRGAKKAYLCDKEKDAIEIIKQNLAKTKLEKNAIVINKNYEKCLQELPEKIDIIYIDPPYKMDLAIKAIEYIEKLEILKDNGTIIIETDEKDREIEELSTLNSKYQIYDIRKYGRAYLIFLRRKGKIMEIFTLLETIEDILENSKEIPFSHKALVDKEELLEIIKEIRLKLPEELKQAKVIKEEHDRIISKAQEEANDIVKEAENRIISMIDEHEITKKAYEQKNKIIENANDMAREISNGTKAYADSVLESIQVALEDALKVIENNRKEVK